MKIIKWWYILISQPLLWSWFIYLCKRMILADIISFQLLIINIKFKRTGILHYDTLAQPWEDQIPKNFLKLSTYPNFYFHYFHIILNSILASAMNVMGYIVGKREYCEINMKDV